MEILINNRQDKLTLSDNLISNIKKAILICLEIEKHNINVEISLSFVDNEEIKKINKEFRNIDTPTDVLSFPLDIDFFIEDINIPLGDIIISTEKAREQSLEFGHSLEREIIYLVIHSMFHLLGYDHIKNEDAIKMRNKEKEAIRKIGIYKNEK
ncbi:rRNA maturation RNase YbeY [Miniphocaeibacter halophilus]|uniref:rRNA maturation RNase YbeY n=1 Tax=Miniphocaeibacter halophilus TaxID=2931922 RepID=A0AC61MQ28_9FIRM|nr:rRNA maturation RNase YbeY [Miniphocaeibacter halophilus]QQK07675.1 rRNA maturation RNase YbeY [Miniphocaeibacter halophilus]